MSDTDNQKAQAEELQRQASDQFNRSEYPAAIESWQQSLDIYREIGDKQGAAYCLDCLGLAYNALGQYQRAIEFHNQELAIKREIGNRRGEAVALGNLGKAYRSLGEYQRAIDFYNQELAICREIGHRQWEAASLGDLGLTYDSLGQYQKAIEFHQQSLAIFKEIGDREGKVASLRNLGNATNKLFQQGNDQFNRSEYPAAIESWQQSLEIYRQIGSRGGEAHALNGLGCVYLSLGQHQRAIEFLQQSLAIRREIGDRGGEAASLCNLGNAYDSLGQYQEAIEFLQQSLAISREIGHRQWAANSLSSLGIAYKALGQYQEAIEFHQQSLAIKREIGDRKGEAASLNNLGIAYKALGQYKEAIEFHQQSLAIKREIGDRGGEAASLCNLGNAYNSLGQYQKAIDFLQQSLAISREIGHREWAANSLGNLGYAYKSLGQYQRAIEFLQQSLAIEREIGDRGGEDASLESLGYAYDALGQYQRAIEFLQQSLAIKREIGDRKGEAASLNNLGNVYKALGQYERAIEFYAQSLAIEREIGNRGGQAASLCNLGNAYNSLGQYQRAIEFHQQSLAIEREICNRGGEAASLCNLGNAYNSLGQYQRAIEFLQQSLVISREIGHRQWEANSLGNLGSAYYSLGQYKEAIEFYQQSLAIKRKISDRGGEAASLCNLGSAYLSLGQYQKAIKFYNKSLAISRKIGHREWEANSLSNLGSNYLQLVNLNKNRSSTLPKILKFLLRQPCKFFANYCLQEAEAKLRQAMEVYESLREDLADENKISIFETQVGTYILLQQALVAQDKFNEALAIAERGRARAFVEELRRRLGWEGSDDFIDIPQMVAVAQEQNATLVEYSIVSEDIYIWVISPRGEISFRRANLSLLTEDHYRDIAPNGEFRKRLETLILQARVSLGIAETDKEGNPIPRNPRFLCDDRGYPLMRLLYDILIGPILDLLPESPNQIIFIPHYELFLVPFAALQDAAGQYVIEKYPIRIAPSIQVLQTARQRHLQLQLMSLMEREKALVVGDPKIHPKWTQHPDYQLQQLVRAREAAEAIGQLFATTPLLGEQATKVAVIDKMRNVRVVQIFAHGLLDDFGDKGIPGTIILAPSDAADETDDGGLNAGEILDLKLSAEIVILTACSTGKGKITGDGVVGLSRCFVLAGVPSLIVSLWDIGAPAAKFLMVEFYQNLERGENRATALRQAMLTAKNGDIYNYPKAWAGFTLIGEADHFSLTLENFSEVLRRMSIPDNTEPEVIVKALSGLLDIDNPQNKAQYLQILSQLLQPNDTLEQQAAKIRETYAAYPALEDKIENEIATMGFSDAKKSTPEMKAELAREFEVKVQENLNRQNNPTPRDKP